MSPENEQKIRYLSRYRQIGERVDRLLDEKRRWRELAVKITPGFSPVPGGGGNGSRIERSVEKVLEIEAQLAKEIDGLCTARQEIGGTLDRMEDETLKLLMEYRYIDGLTWEQVAEKMHYSWRQVCRKHEKALEQIGMS